MSWELLPTNFTDAVWSGLKRYTQINNQDGTVSFQDVTQYSQLENSFFGALIANRMNEALNAIMTALENGTDLYEVFQTFFTNQQTAFSASAQSIITTEQSNVDALYAAFQTYVAGLESDSDDWFDTFKTNSNAEMTSIETGYASRMANYEAVQQALFNQWFADIRSTLSDDVAGQIINRMNATDALNFNRYYGLVNKTTAITTNQQGNKVITETDLSELVVAVTVISTLANGNKQIVTVVTPEEGGYKYTKTTIIADVDSVIVYYEREVDTVTPVGNENPSEEGWYVLDDGEYVLTEDTEVQAGTTYYTLTYIQVEAQEGDNPASEGWYIYNGHGYVLTEDTSVIAGKRITENYVKEAK